MTAALFGSDCNMCIATLFFDCAAAFVRVHAWHYVLGVFIVLWCNTDTATLFFC